MGVSLQGRCQQKQLKSNDEFPVRDVVGGRRCSRGLRRGLPTRKAVGVRAEAQGFCKRRHAVFLAVRCIIRLYILAKVVFFKPYWKAKQGKVLCRAQFTAFNHKGSGRVRRSGFCIRLCLISCPEERKPHQGGKKDSEQLHDGHGSQSACQRYWNFRPAGATWDPECECGARRSPEVPEIRAFG